MKYHQCLLVIMIPRTQPLPTLPLLIEIYYLSLVNECALDFLLMLKVARSYDKLHLTELPLCMNKVPVTIQFLSWELTIRSTHPDW